ncbi:FHA domain-containing protein [Candidatus Peregrinibacteria bacterium]|nr:FHA domain-containing protein [Candidatus Peregrinibacteria bacterium]
MSLKAKLVRVDDFGIEADGERQTIVIDDVTHLGRSSSAAPRTNRVRGEMLTDAKVVIKIEDPDAHVSRNHVLIYPPRDSTGDFRIVDLYSLNGTYVNGEKIPGNRQMPLRRDDELQLAVNSVRFQLRISPDSESDTNYGLMVGHRGYDLPDIANDIGDLRREFEARGFRGNIDTLFDADATLKNIRRRLEVLQRYATKDSLFLFFFLGHGKEDGSLSLGKELLSPNELFSLLENFRGRILIILDGCHTHAMARHEPFPQHAALVGHKGEAYCSYTTNALRRVLKTEPHRIDVRRLVERVMQDPRIQGRQVVRAHDTSHIELVSRMSPVRRK